VGVLGPPLGVTLNQLAEDVVTLTVWAELSLAEMYKDAVWFADTLLKFSVGGLATSTAFVVISMVTEIAVVPLEVVTVTDPV
jgi:hypothetical protein